MKVNKLIIVPIDKPLIPSLNNNPKTIEDVINIPTAVKNDLFICVLLSQFHYNKQPNYLLFTILHLNSKKGTSCKLKCLRRRLKS